MRTVMKGVLPHQGEEGIKLDYTGFAAVPRLLNFKNTQYSHPYQ